MPKFRYEGGPQHLAVVLPDRTVEVAAGDVVDVSADEAERLALHPDFTAVKATAKKAAGSNPSEED